MTFNLSLCLYTHTDEGADFEVLMLLAHCVSFGGITLVMTASNNKSRCAMQLLNV